MDYQKFYAEIADWINQCNQMAGSHGFDSDQFWSWAMKSMAELSNKYENTKLVVKQMVMLYEWLDETYQEWVNKK